MYNRNAEKLKVVESSETQPWTYDRIVIRYGTILEKLGPYSVDVKDFVLTSKCIALLASLMRSKKVR